MPWLNATTPSTFGNAMHHRRRTVDRRHDPDVVARGDLSVGAHDAEKARLLGLGQDRRRHVIAGVRVVPVELLEVHVVRMDVGAGRNVARCKADADVVLEDGLAGAQVARRDLMPGRDLAAADDAFGGYGHAYADGHARHHDVVRGMQPDDGAGCTFFSEIDHVWIS
jgi:hypothetical protein